MDPSIVRSILDKGDDSAIPKGTVTEYTAVIKMISEIHAASDGSGLFKLSPLDFLAQTLNSAFVPPEGPLQ